MNVMHYTGKERNRLCSSINRRRSHRQVIVSLATITLAEVAALQGSLPVVTGHEKRLGSCSSHRWRWRWKLGSSRFGCWGEEGGFWGLGFRVLGFRRGSGF